MKLYYFAFLILFVAANILISLRLVPNSERPKEKKVSTANVDNISATTTLEKDRHGKKWVCAGRNDYYQWFQSLFELAPMAPPCQYIRNFSLLFNDSARNPFIAGSMLLQRNSKFETAFSAQSYFFHDIPARQKTFMEIWKQANLLRNLPPNLELILYVNDKPRVQKGFELPVFSVVVDHLSPGHGKPRKWTGVAPYPSTYYTQPVPAILDVLPSFAQRRPVVYFRGQFSENVWSSQRLRNIVHNSTQLQDVLQVLSSYPRTKLAMAGSQSNDADVLDIKMTAFAGVRGSDPYDKQLRTFVQKHFNVSVGQWERVDLTNARYALSVPGNGWAGATTMAAFLSGACVLFVEDNSTDNEGYTRDYGELYFAFLKPENHYVPVRYKSIASTARYLNLHLDKAEQIRENGFKFAKKFLGLDCALDAIEAMSWVYYDYILSSCKTAFDHVVPQGN